MTTIDGGRAVVNVVTRASEASLAATGRLIEKKLEQSAKRSGDVFARQFDISLGRGAVLFGAFNSLAAPLASTISQLGAGVVSLGASFQQTAIAATSFTGVLTSLIQVTTVANTAFNNFGKAVTADTPEKLQKALKGMGPAAVEAVTAVRSLSGEWGKLRASVQEAVFKDFGDSIKNVAEVLLPVLKTQMTQTGYVMNLFFKDLEKFTTSASFVERFTAVMENNNDVFDRLRIAALPFLDGLLNLLVALGPSAERLATSIGKVATRFQEWTSQAGFAERIDGIMRRAQETAGLLLRTIGNLAQALGAVFTAAAPAGNTFLTMLNNMFVRFEAFAKSAEGKAQIAAWAERGIESMARLGQTLKDLGPVFSALADPAVFDALLKVLDSWAKTMAVLAPLLTTTAKALGFFAPLVGPAIALSGVFFAFTLQAKILKGVLGSLGLGNLARGFLSSSAAASEATGVMGTLGGRIARTVDGIRLQTKAMGGPGLFAAAKAQFVAFGTFVAGIGTKIVAGVKAIGTAIRLAFIANPVGVIITGLVLLGVALFALYKRSETFRNAVNAVWGAIKVAAAATVEWFTTTALPALQTVWDGIVAGAQAVGGFFATIWGGIVTAFSAVWTALLAVWTAVGVPIFNLIRGAIMIFVKALEIAWTLIQVAWALIWFGLQAAWSAVGQPLIDLIQAAWGLFVAGLALTWALIQVAWDAVWSALTAAWDAVGQPLIDLIQAGWAMFVDNLEQIWNQLTAAWDVVWGAITAVWEAVGAPLFDAITTVWDTLVAAAETITGAIGDFFRGMWDGVVEAATGALNGLIGIMNGIIDGVNQLVAATNKLTGAGIGKVSKIPELATGVRNFRGGVALVGEEGPELVNLPRGSNVHTAAETRQMTGGGNTINITYNEYGPQTGADRKRRTDWDLRYGAMYGPTSSVAPAGA